MSPRFTDTSIRLSTRSAWNAGRTSAQSVGLSQFAQTSASKLAGPSSDRRHSRTARLAVRASVQSIDLASGSARPSAKSSNRQLAGRSPEKHSQKRGTPSELLSTMWTLGTSLDQLGAKSAGSSQSRLRAHTSTTMSLCGSGGFAVRATFDGTRPNRSTPRYALLFSRWEAYTGKTAELLNG